MELMEHSQLTIIGATWEDAILSVTPTELPHLAPGFARVPETWRELVTDMGLDPKQIIFSAVHSHVAMRHVEFKDGENVLFLEDNEEYDDINASHVETRGWHIITKSNFVSAKWQRDDSSIRIESREDGLFDVTGTFPVEDGHRYEGHYYEIMMQPANRIAALSRFDDLCISRREQFCSNMMKIIDESEVASLPGFQDWEGPVDPEPFKDVADRYEVYAEQGEVLIDELPVKALMFVGASGWDEWYHYQRDELVAENPGVEFPDFEPLVWGVCQIA